MWPFHSNRIFIGTESAKSPANFAPLAFIRATILPANVHQLASPEASTINNGIGNDARCWKAILARGYTATHIGLNQQPMFQANPRSDGFDERNFDAERGSGCYGRWMICRPNSSLTT